MTREFHKLLAAYLEAQDMDLKERNKALAALEEWEHRQLAKVHDLEVGLTEERARHLKTIAALTKEHMTNHDLTGKLAKQLLKG